MKKETNNQEAKMKQEEKKENKDVVSENNKTVIKTYLEQRLGVYGVRSFELQYEETPTLTYKACLKQSIDLPKLGIFSHALIDCTLIARIYLPEEKANTSLVTCNLNYSHIDGGSNGCDLGIEFKVSRDGRVIEIYK